MIVCALSTSQFISINVSKNILEKNRGVKDSGDRKLLEKKGKNILRNFIIKSRQSFWVGIMISVFLGESIKYLGAFEVHFFLSFFYFSCVYILFSVFEVLFFSIKSLFLSLIFNGEMKTRGYKLNGEL